MLAALLTTSSVVIIALVWFGWIAGLERLALQLKPAQSSS